MIFLSPLIKGVTSTVKASLEESLVQILSPRRRVDILRDAMDAKKRGKPFSITFCGVNGVGKSTNLAKVTKHNVHCEEKIQSYLSRKWKRPPCTARLTIPHKSNVWNFIWMITNKCIHKVTRSTTHIHVVPCILCKNKLVNLTLFFINFVFSDLLLAAWQWFPCDDCSLWHLPCWRCWAAEDPCTSPECSSSSGQWQWASICTAVWKRLW